ncbi:hypothetical protein ACHAWU_006634 [Discostella pseudostelligera]|uniref:Uncharacterized protein n=1 Tax=Discostella pseudostelligera TaxID=259834 RepID=A0ABD3MDT3_9STRA
MTIYSTAANWLEAISGTRPNTQVIKKDETKDPILRDLRVMKDTETRETRSHLPPPRNRGDLPNGRNAAHVGGAHLQQQPKPKFVAHKDPTRGKVRKEKGSSDRLGGNHMA